MEALFGSRLSANITLATQILMFITLWVGVYFILTGQERKHCNTQTTLIGVSFFFVASFMIISFYDYVIAGGARSGVVAWLMITHGVSGLVVEITGIYLILLIRTTMVPARLRIEDFKPVMRTVLVLWCIVALIGFGIYYFRYVSPGSAGVAAPGPGELPNKVEISMEGFKYLPVVVTIKLGGTITWTNNHAVVHTVTSDDGRFDSGVVSQDGQFSFTFSEEGAFRYYCVFHGAKGGVGMAGEVIVRR